MINSVKYGICAPLFVHNVYHHVVPLIVVCFIQIRFVLLLPFDTRRRLLWWMRVDFFAYGILLQAVSVLKWYLVEMLLIPVVSG